jgi:hypothetical protein
LYVFVALDCVEPVAILGSNTIVGAEVLLEHEKQHLRINDVQCLWQQQCQEHPTVAAMATMSHRHSANKWGLSKVYEPNILQKVMRLAIAGTMSGHCQWI